VVTIERPSPIAVWRQLAAILRAQIESGELPPGGMLPSESQLMGQYEVSRDTARKAVRHLQELGLVVTSKGLGSFVTK
jgi:DNA-binding GntR family transcriptional regulator